MFNKQNFCHVASNNRNEKKAGIFVYKTTDDLATVSTSGYFNEKIIDINLHDLIIHEWHDIADRTKVQKNVLCVTERTLDNVGTVVIKSKLEEDIEDAIEDLQEYVDNTFVRKDGTSVMTGPLLMRATDDFKCAIAPYWDGVGFFKLNNNNSVTLMASLEYEEGFTPADPNIYNIGTMQKKWHNLYLAGTVFANTINNGSNLAVPNPGQADTLALKSQVDDAANSGEQLYTTGVWFAKMYAATVVPTGAEYDGKNYADFSQVDNDNNPIIVIYEGQSGAWVQIATITPPANHNGYMTITSKIWDIVEQSGQQGGLVLWSHNQKTFTPYPRIVSFESINITGNSTVTMPGTPTDNSIPNKKYVDDKFASQTYHPDIFDWKWADHELNDQSWLRADTFSWQDGTVYSDAYQHLVDEYDNLSKEEMYDVGISDVSYFRSPEFDMLGETHPYAYTSYRGPTVNTIYGDTNNATLNANYYTTASGSTVFGVSNSRGVSEQPRPTIETIGATKIAYYTASDGHKIVWFKLETEIGNVYSATGIAWYYILDTVNQRFKLPRTKFGVVGLRDTVGNYVAPGLPNITGLITSNNYAGTAAADSALYPTGNGQNSDLAGTGPNAIGFDASRSNSIYGASTTVQAPATQQYLYFYVGGFTQSATEQTAGLNASLFNNKVDISGSWGAPSSQYEDWTLGASGSTYTAPADGYVYLWKVSNAVNQYITLTNNSNGLAIHQWSPLSGGGCAGYVPVKKGDIVTITYTAGGSTNMFRFIYAQKSN